MKAGSQLPRATARADTGIVPAPIIALKYRDWLRWTVTSTYPLGIAVFFFGPPRYVWGDVRIVTVEEVPSLLNPFAEAMDSARVAAVPPESKPLFVGKFRNKSS